MIEVHDLSKSYGRRVAIDSLDFSVGEGEIVGFLGPNGAGKTTTMRIMAGYLAPTRGRVLIDGLDVIHQSMEARRRIGYLPESVPLYDELTVSGYLRFMGSLRKVDSLEKRIARVLDQIGLSDRAESFNGSLSKGLRQRVGLAQAILHDPPILILDEPTIGLDPAQIKETQAILAELGKSRTVLLSTHILSEAEQLCDRVLIIDHGQIVAQDTPDNLRRQLDTTFHILVRANTSSLKLREVLRVIEGVEQVRDHPGGEGVVEVWCEPGDDLRPLIARAVVDAGIDLLEIRPIDLSLEEIYLQLVRAEKDTS
jgi:ABC-2 type transport system ATP-binding protein